MQRGENIVIEGTFSWPGLGERMLRQLGAAGYERFTIMDVEVPRERAQQQALQRWWDGRQHSEDNLGGRFTPAAVIAALYPGDGTGTICAANARAAFDHHLAPRTSAPAPEVNGHPGTAVSRTASARSSSCGQSLAPSARRAGRTRRKSLLRRPQAHPLRLHAPIREAATTPPRARSGSRSHEPHRR